MKKTILLALTFTIAFLTNAQTKSDSTSKGYSQLNNSNLFTFKNTPVVAVATEDTLTIREAKYVSIGKHKLTLDSLVKLIEKKPDTVRVPLYYRQEPIKVSFIYGKSILKRGTGYLLLTGFKVPVNDSTFTWASQPNVLSNKDGALVFDDKGKIIPDVELSSIREIKEADKPKPIASIQKKQQGKTKQ